mmetsp:Transcript_24900/g.59311  ORF Transcript_24900/g.59311 Transcript_24900/m.59311 type:complete len:218 (+) Transcript_24900:404-1057(+)
MKAPMSSAAALNTSRDRRPVAATAAVATAESNAFDVSDALSSFVSTSGSKRLRALCFVPSGPPASTPARSASALPMSGFSRVICFHCRDLRRWPISAEHRFHCAACLSRSVRPKSSVSRCSSSSRFRSIARRSSASIGLLLVRHPGRFFAMNTGLSTEDAAVLARSCAWFRRLSRRASWSRSCSSTSASKASIDALSCSSTFLSSSVICPPSSEARL